MYSPITEDEKDLFQSKTWKVNMTISPVEGDVITVTDENLVLGSLTVDRYTATSDALPIGTATAGQLSFTLDNADHVYDGVVFAGATIHLLFYVVDDNGVDHPLEVGYFTIDEAPRILDSITIVALDAMCQFDVIPEITFTGLNVGGLVEALADVAGVTMGTTVSTLPNYDYAILSAPANFGELTARQLLQYCCQIMGVNAQIGRDNSLYLIPYGSTVCEAFDESLRYSSDIREDIVVTGVSVSSETGDTTLQGNEGYVLEIKDNPLIQTNPSSLDMTFLNGITFAPFSAVVVPMPWLDCGDLLTFTKEGVDHSVYVTKITQTINANTALEGTGLSEVRNGFATIDPLTVREQQILRDIRTRASEAVSSAEQNAISFSTVIANSLGLYDLSVTNVDGTTTFYFGDKPSLNDCNTIYTFRQDGFAWTDHEGYLIDDWHYGFTSDGNAMLRMLTLYKLTADQIESRSITATQLNLEASDTIFGGKTVAEVIDSETDDLQKEVEENTEEFIRQRNYIRIGELDDGDYGVAIGYIVDGNFVMGSKFIRNRLSFFDNDGNEVAYISDAQLYIYNAEIKESLKIGGFRKTVESDGSVTERWVGIS